MADQDSLNDDEKQSGPWLRGAFSERPIDCKKISLESVDGPVHIACHINRTVNDDRGRANSARFRR
jgi:hypothetical protein